MTILTGGALFLAPSPSALAARSSSTRAGLFCAATIAWVDSEGCRRGATTPTLKLSTRAQFAQPKRASLPRGEPNTRVGFFSLKLTAEGLPTPAGAAIWTAMAVARVKAKLAA